ncbi:MAG TPA: hypothetical protein VEM38_12440 [Burkholderiales bacterium]|nr:hypothetical protein [Burkholderiales bacterium]
MSPEETSGPPEVMPTNDWWNTDLTSQVIGGVTKVALARAATPAADRGVIASNPKNPPPGGGGLFPQAAATGGAAVTPGGAPRSERMTADGDTLAIAGVPVSLIVVGLVVAGLVFFFLKRRR